MIGYRYVSADDWAEIQERGLLPRRIKDWSVLQYFDEDKVLKGIWIWQRPLIETEHIGAVIHQAIQKSSMKVYLLEIHYRKKWMLQHKDYRSVNITHNGKLGNWTGWSNGTPIAILTRQIAKKNVRLIEEIDLVKTLWLKSKRIRAKS